MLKVTTLTLLFLLTLGFGALPAHANTERRLTQRQVIDLWSSLDNDAVHASVEVTQAGEKLRIPPEAIRQFFKILKGNRVPLILVHSNLTHMAERHRQLVEVLTAVTDDASTKALMDDARAALAQGDYDGTDAALAMAEQFHLDLALREAAAASEHNNRAAQKRSERGRIAMVHYDHPTAARLFRGAINLTSSADRERLRAYNWFLAEALIKFGYEKDDNDALLQAIDAYRVYLRETGGRELMPAEWAFGQNSLGIALAILGIRKHEPTRLEEAVVAFRLALQEFTREREPVKWVSLQANLGETLSRLDRGDDGTRQEEAVAAFRLMLQETSKDRAPLDWAGRQLQLGKALVGLGRTEQMKLSTRKSGTARLKEALATYRMALEEIPREHEPWDWAATQEAIGDVSMSLADSERGSAWLEEAVAAYGRALEEYTPDRAPRHWHRAHQSMESATTLLGFERQPRDSSPTAGPGQR